jgi:hypothetical protein
VNTLPKSQDNEYKSFPELPAWLRIQNPHHQKTAHLHSITLMSILANLLQIQSKESTILSDIPVQRLHIPNTAGKPVPLVERFCKAFSASFDSVDKIEQKNPDRKQRFLRTT